MIVYDKITDVELYGLFGDQIPWDKLRQMFDDASEERTVDDLRTEVRSLAASMRGEAQ